MLRGRRTALLVVGGIILLGILVELIPWGNLIPAFAETNPPVTSTIKWDSPRTEQLVRTSCFDCHSNETTWPWYAKLAPFSWLIAHDTNEGRQKLNFSTQSASQIDPNKLIEQINRGTMPKGIYTIMHPAAKLTDQDKADLIAGLRASLGSAALTNNQPANSTQANNQPTNSATQATPLPPLGTPPVIPNFGDDGGGGEGGG